MNITDKFEKMGARVKVQRGTTPMRRLFNSATPPEDSVRLDILRDKKGAFFDIRTGINVDLEVLDVKPKDRHLLLMARNSEGKSKFLCGHDERDWFIAAIPESSPASTVATAKEALKPEVVKESQDKKGIKYSHRSRRKTKAYRRQGEWFFVPSPDLKVDKKLILTNEPLQRGNGKPHMAEFLYRIGGETVYVNQDHPNGINAKEYAALSSNARKVGGFRVMQRDATVYVKGKIRHSDHKTINLNDWCEVQPNTETQAKAMKHMRFLD